MSFAQETGYVPVPIEDIMESIMEGINTQFGTTYTIETFVGTNFYKYFYALAQRIQENEVKASEIFTHLQDYFDFTNETILRPKVTPNGLIDTFAAEGWTVSVKEVIEAEAGQCFICVDVDEEGDDYAAEKLEICTLIKDNVAAGIITMGTETEALTLTNGQEFDFSFNLPDRVEVWLRLTVTLSRNNQVAILTPEEQKQALIDNIASLYALGKDFEPERYFTTADAPWASDILLEYSVDEGSNWETEVFESEYDDLFVVLLENITLIET